MCYHTGMGQLAIGIIEHSICATMSYHPNDLFCTRVVTGVGSLRRIAAASDIL